MGRALWNAITKSLGNEFMYYRGRILRRMTLSVSLATPKGPTVSTLRAIEEVLRREAVPMTRYRIRQALGHRVSGRLLDQGLAYMADHDMVYDEGPGGRVLWIHAPVATKARMASRIGRGRRTAGVVEP